MNQTNVKPLIVGGHSIRTSLEKEVEMTRTKKDGHSRRTWRYYVGESQHGLVISKRQVTTINEGFPSATQNPLGQKHSCILVLYMRMQRGITHMQRRGMIQGSRLPKPGDTFP
jgi:hypothetical protein